MTSPPDDVLDPDHVARTLQRGAIAGFFATDLRRESGCPVHFVWDGNGRGRPFVRVGFLLALVAGAASSWAAMTHGSTTVAGALGAAAAASWALGQVLTRASRARR
ncbi:MAG: hypothetical protein FJ137_05385 [Deltaproteobacteria bacterium]|nr:hypothetical protein [Deltaproteobacteria bacterium]